MNFFNLAAFSFVILATNCLGAIIGAGSTVIAIPLCVIMLGIEVTKPVLTVYGLLLNIYLLFVSWKHIDFSVLKRILLIMGAGLPVGIAAYGYLPKTLLQQILSIFILLVAIRGLILIFMPHINMGKPGELLLKFILFCSGIIQGAFTTGGPLLIIYVTEKIKEQKAFRSTQAVVWVFTNGIMAAHMQYDGQLTAEIWKITAYGIPALIAGALLGNRLHYRINQKVFNIITYCLLLATGAIMAFNTFK